MLDRLREAFPYVIAVVLPLAGVIIAAFRYSEGARDAALRVALAALLGMCLYGLFVF